VLIATATREKEQRKNEEKRKRKRENKEIDSNSTAKSTKKGRTTDRREDKGYASISRIRCLTKVKIVLKRKCGVHQ
jgi:hypothetical protein